MLQGKTDGKQTDIIYINDEGYKIEHDILRPEALISEYYKDLRKAQNKPSINGFVQFVKDKGFYCELIED